MNQRNILRHNNSEKKLIINNVNYIDIDKYRDELIKLKQELNKRNKEYQELKVEYLKLENENKSNLKLMELIVYESNANNTQSSQTMNISEMNNNDNINLINEDINNNNYKTNIIFNNQGKNKKRNLCKQTIQKIKEKYLYSKMKEEIAHLREEISEKDILMNHLKNSSKIIRLRELDNKYADTYNELVELKDKQKKMEYIQQDYYYTKNKLSNLLQQLDYYKKQGKQQKEQIEKISLQNQNYIKIIENNEKEENKKKFFKIENEKLKKQINELKEYNVKIIEEEQNFRNKNKDKNRKLKNENKKLKEENAKYIKEIERLKKILNEKENKKEDNKDDFFMTSAKIIVDNNNKENNNNDNNNEEKNNNDIKDNINLDEMSIIEKNNEDKKLETKDIEIMDLKSENEKK